MKTIVRAVLVSTLSLAVVVPSFAQQKPGAMTAKPKVETTSSAASTGDTGSPGTSDKPPRNETYRLNEGGGGGTTHDVPEIDPGLAGSAAVLLVGGLLLLTDRRRRTA